MDTSPEKLEELVTDIVGEYQNLDAACRAVINVGAMDQNGALYTAIWQTFDKLLQHIDHDGWIAWFIFENACGKRGMEAIVNGESIKVETPAQLAQLILEE